MKKMAMALIMKANHQAKMQNRRNENENNNL
jgi:hypothetical protein